VEKNPLPDHGQPHPADRAGCKPYGLQTSGAGSQVPPFSDNCMAATEALPAIFPSADH